MGFEVTVSNSRVHVPDLRVTVIPFSVYLVFLPCAECLVVCFFKIELHTTALMPYFSGLFFHKFNSKHITSKQDEGDKSVISTNLVKTGEVKSPCPLQMDKRFLGPIWHSLFCSQISVILILITTLLARIHTPIPQTAPEFLLSPQGSLYFSGLLILQKCDGI